MYETEYKSAFYRYYAMQYYMMVGGWERNTSEFWLLLNEYEQWDRLAEQAFNRGE